jgi:hypothetical protein
MNITHRNQALVFAVVYFICCGNEDTLSLFSDISCFVIIRKSLDFIFNALPVLVGALCYKPQRCGFDS